MYTGCSAEDWRVWVIGYGECEYLRPSVLRIPFADQDTMKIKFFAEGWVRGS
jgi:hypothetical protein